MKMFFLVAGLMLSAQTVFAQRTCHVEMYSTTTNNETARYQLPGDYNCRRALDQCRMDAAGRNRDCRVIYRTNPGPGPGPGPGPIPGPGPGPIPGPTPGYTSLSCKWFDGYSPINGRGWHAYQSQRGYPVSMGFYGNDAAYSQERCIRDVVFNLEGYDYQRILQQSAQTSCECKWFDGTRDLSARGWHMTYSVYMPDGALARLSSRFYQNEGYYSENNCRRDLAMNGYVCPVR